MIVPLGALPGFSLAADVREVAAYYRVKPRQLRAGTQKAELFVVARHALFWKLTRHRRLTPGRVAQLLNCTPKAVREGAAHHERRIAEFRQTSGVEGSKK